MPQLPETGFLRLPQIIGDPKAGIPPIIPVKKSSWWAGVKAGRYPQPVKLGPRVTAWRVEDIRALIEQLRKNIFEARVPVRRKPREGRQNCQSRGEHQA